MLKSLVAGALLILAAPALAQTTAQIEDAWTTACQAGGQKKMATTQPHGWSLQPGESPWQPGYEKCEKIESMWRDVQARKQSADDKAKLDALVK